MELNLVPFVLEDILKSFREWLARNDRRVAEPVPGISLELDKYTVTIGM
jgi:hypothetical protein